VDIEVRTVTRERWADLQALFTRSIGPRGGKPVTQGCWCMFWRADKATFERGWGRGKQRGEGNRAALHRLVDEEREPGLLAYVDGRPAGWCSIAPRLEFVRLETSRSLAPVDDQPVWSVACFYIDPEVQRHGIGGALLHAAVTHAQARGATIVEGYPSKPGDDDPSPGWSRCSPRLGSSR
jgi:GNAT superfamily N-acetyltransferase